MFSSSNKILCEGVVRSSYWPFFVAHTNEATNKLAIKIATGMIKFNISTKNPDFTPKIHKLLFLKHDLAHVFEKREFSLQLKNKVELITVNELMGIKIAAARGFK